MPTSEFDIIEQYFNKESIKDSNVVAGIGDDAALIKVPDDHFLAISTDTLVEGIHFLSSTKPFDIGYKSLAVNLSDMAAMAAKPNWLLLSLTMPEFNHTWLTEFTNGFFNLANSYELGLIGGNLTRGPLSITVQIIGSLPHGQELRRSTAKPGDLIYVTGVLGMASMALLTLQGDVENDHEISEDCLSKLYRPEPRVNIGISLRNIATAAIDISDGIAADLQHLVNASHVGAEVRLEDIPIYEELKKLDADKIWSYSLNKGDDYELCFTANRNSLHKIEEISHQFSCPISCIGRITEGHDIQWKTATGELININSKGYLHF